MNKQRRNNLERAVTLLNEAKDILSTCAQEEQEAYDNMPEGIQSSEKGEAMETAAQALDEADTFVNDALNSIDAALVL